MMNAEQFLNKLSRAMDLDPGTALGMESVLVDLPFWDSLVVISIVAMLDLEFEVLTTADQVMKCKTVGDIYRMVEGKAR